MVGGFILDVYGSRTAAVAEPSVEPLGVDDPLAPANSVKVDIKFVKLAVFFVTTIPPAPVFAVSTSTLLGGVSFHSGMFGGFGDVGKY